MIKSGLEKLQHLHVDLQKIVNECAKTHDFIVLCTLRDKTAQEAAFHSGHSHAEWGDSPHDYDPSLAVDLAPWPLDWKNLNAFDALAVAMKAAALSVGIQIDPSFWGGDWPKLGYSICDRPHFQLANWKHCWKGLAMETTAKWIGALLLLIAVFSAGDYFRGETDTAAQVVPLQEQVKVRDQKLVDTSVKIDNLRLELIKSNGQRAALESKLASWHETETGQLAVLEKNSNETVASKNPICWPTDDERRMRNETIRAFTDRNYAVDTTTAKGN